MKLWFSVFGFGFRWVSEAPIPSALYVHWTSVPSLFIVVSLWQTNVEDFIRCKCKNISAEVFDGFYDRSRSHGKNGFVEF